MKIEISPNELIKIIETFENRASQYTADMTEVYKNIGALTKRVLELENKSVKE